MPTGLSVNDARALLGDDVLGADDAANVFGTGVDAPPIPFSSEELAVAKTAGDMLVLRLATVGNQPLTVQRLIQGFPQSFDERYLRKMGYQLRDDWGIELEPLAGTDTCTFGWALVCKDILADTRNLAYDEQDVVVETYRNGVRRRSAVEAAYDTLLYFGARKVRLLETTWDWTGSRTVDGGYLNVGGFGAAGLQVLSFSRAVRHGALGVCPTRQPAV
jgi:hypothetical protein